MSSSVFDFVNEIWVFVNADANANPDVPLFTCKRLETCHFLTAFFPRERDNRLQACRAANADTSMN